MRKEKERNEGKRHTEAYRRDRFSSDVGAGHRRRGGYRRYGEHGRVRRVGVGAPPQRPLLVHKAPIFLPFCYFAYRRSLWGLVLTLLALVASMFWFPVPENPSAAVNEMLASEREYLTTDWTLWKVFIALLVPLTFAALGLAFWKRSLLWGLAVVNAAILFKIAWTFLFSTEAGALSHLPAAVLGLVVCDALILYVIGRIRARSSYGRPRPGEHHS